MRYFTVVLSVFLVWAVAGSLHAQDLLSDQFQSEIHFRKTGMLVLGSWAAANIAGDWYCGVIPLGATVIFTR